jgi:hypothetical protein
VNLAKLTGPGIDLVADEPDQALELLTDTLKELDAAAAAKVSSTVIAPLRAKTVAGLDRLYGVVPVASTRLFQFTPAEGAEPINLRTMVRGPDDMPYVIDASTKSVYRVNLAAKTATLVARTGQKADGTTVGNLRFLAAGGLDLLILDAKNVLWRWRPADDKGKGTLKKVTVQGAASWGDDVTGINTFLRDASKGLYNLYVVDPSEQQIRAYQPAADGSGFPGKPTEWLATARDTSAMVSTYVDGDLFAADHGALIRFVSGKDEGWDAKAPKDTLLRPGPSYSLVAADADRREGEIYGFDRPNGRIVALDKVDGTYRAQYRLAGGAKDWSDLRAMYVIAGTEEKPATLVWLSRDGVHQAVLEAVPDVAPIPSASPVPSASPAGASPKPTKKP